MATEKIDILQVDTEPSKVSVKDLRKELKSLKDELLNLEEGTKEYNATLQKAAGIQQTLKDQTQEVNASAMDAGQILGNATNAVAGMTGAFQAGVGVMNLFGVESEASMEMLAKMQNLMAVTQGFQAIDDGVKAFGRLGKAIKSSTVAQKLFGDAQVVSAAKTKILELATKAWGKALIATGIGAIIVLIGTLIANLDKLTAAFESSSKKAARAAKETSAAMVKGMENEIQIMEASGATIDELYKKNYELYLMKRQQMAADLKAIKNKNSEEYKEAKAALEALDQAQKVANAKYKTQVNDRNTKVTEANQKAIDDAKKQREKAAEAKRKERENQRQQDLDYIDSVNAELAAKRRTDEENELFELEEKYEKEKSLLEEYNIDTAELEETYKAEINAIKTKYNDEAEAKAKEDNEKKSAEILANYEAQVEATELGEQQLLATRMEMLANGQLTQQEFDDLNKEAADNKLNDEIANLELLLEKEELIGEERIKVEEKLAAKKIELNQKVLDDKKANADAEVKVEQGKTGNLLKIAGELSGIMSSAADMAEEGSKEQKALKISSAIIDTIAGAVGAFTGITKDTGGWGIAAAIATAAGVLASGMASVKKMASTPVGKNGGGGGQSIPSISMSSLAASQTPVQATTQVTGASVEDEMKDTRVYVVESDITDTQRKVNTAEAEATF